MQALRILSVVLFSWFMAVSVAHADPLATQDKAKQTWQLLDYLAVDYGGAVRDGKVQSASEYEEMKEFAATAGQQIAALPSTPALPELKRQATALSELIAAKADAKTVADSAHSLAAALVKAYPFPLSPSTPPDLARAKVLFEANCAACHGEDRTGDIGPDLTEAEAMNEAELYQDIWNGIPDGGMPSFSSLGAEKVWKIVTFLRSAGN